MKNLTCVQNLELGDVVVEQLTQTQTYFFEVVEINHEFKRIEFGATRFDLRKGTISQVQVPYTVPFSGLYIAFDNDCKIYNKEELTEFLLGF